MKLGAMRFGKRILSALVLSVIALVGPAAEAQFHRIDPKTPQGLQVVLSYTNGPLPLMSGHRGGAWKGFPENCIPTFERTLRHAYAMLEIDPRLTKDGAVVVHHDATLERTTTGKGRVTDLTLAELRELRLKDLDGQPTDFQMPTLDEVILWARGKTVLVLDQKDLSAVDRAKIVTRHQAEAWVMLIVMNFKDVQAVHQLNPDIAMEVMIPNVAKAREFDALGVPWRNVVAFVGHTPPDDPALYEFIHTKGARCMIGTSRNLDRQFITGQVTDLKTLEPQYRAFLQRGADIIETDIPAPLGQMLYRKTTVPAAVRKYFHAP
jgi:glycerophosphoryl diester phosphodiesterase